MVLINLFKYRGEIWKRSLNRVILRVISKEFLKIFWFEAFLSQKMDGLSLELQFGKYHSSNSYQVPTKEQVITVKRMLSEEKQMILNDIGLYLLLLTGRRGKG